MTWDASGADVGADDRPHFGEEEVGDLEFRAEDRFQPLGPEGGGGVGDACRTRGGSWKSNIEETRCDAVPASAHKRSDHATTLGFRCCG